MQKSWKSKRRQSQIEYDSERTKSVNWNEHEENLSRDSWENTKLL